MCNIDRRAIRNGRSRALPFRVRETEIVGMTLAPIFSPRLVPGAVAGVLISSATVSVVAAQPIAEREFAKPVAVLKESLKDVRSLQELRDGRVLVLDAGDKKVLLADFASGKVDERMSEGNDDKEFRTLAQLWRWPGDSVVSFDQGKTQFVFFGPDGKLARTARFGAPLTGGGGVPDGAAATAVAVGAGAPPGAPPAAGRGEGGPPGGSPGAGRGGGRGGGPPTFRALVGTEALIGAGPSARPTQPPSPGAPPARLPYPILRMSLRRPRPDTVAQLMPAQAPRAPMTNSVGTFMVFVSSAPLQAIDAWAVMRDGTVAVARAASYRIDWYAPDGSHTQTDSIPFNAIPVSSSDRKRVVEDYKKVGEAALAVLPTRTSILAVTYEEPSAWPTVHPPFRGDIMPQVDGKDRIWLATRCASDEQSTCYDVIARDGTRETRFKLPGRTIVIGFGANTVYTLNIQKSDKQILQRYPLP